ncbi:flavin reductase family protein [Plantibacter sp. CFBP 8775]|uniref:flavin reductase family protein n=1 Tax=Plantibacter sp. CFBP 8775 TaxID=2774038 RepID=UPI0017863C9E|nr:flavin reductase family protein [Plantibacter sp. CFBP 8775]MBD8103828.1 flavin reductase family protein [Plantibacter sp. CFBP 8775]
MPRTDFDTKNTSDDEFHKLLTAIVIPRPIAWVSTTSNEGIDNLAPHSFFTVASVSPPIIQFTSVGRKDTLTHIEATREFVVCLTPEVLLEKVNATGTNFPATESEFDRVDIEREPAAKVLPPRAKRSPAALECTLHTIVRIGDCFLVMGRVVHIALDDDALSDGRPDTNKLQPLSRLGDDDWGLTPPARKITRIPIESWPRRLQD